MQRESIRLDIVDFWDWFQVHEHMYRDIVDAQAAVDAMNEQVLQFGLFSWEIGEGKTKPHYLTLSPNGDKGRLELSKKIVAAAPELPQWEFNYCKPPKDWDFTFEAFDQFMIKQQFDASGWEYLLQRNEDSEVEIFILADNLHVLDADDEMNAIDLVLTNVLGEENVIHNLDAFEVVDEFEPQFDDLIEKLPLLRHHFAKFLKG